jgi:Rrf2 family nitric oxide-sensitive transcriptional repressor
MKVVHKLSMRAYLNMVRGRGGGISLARAPTDISIDRVVRDVEPLTIVECGAVYENSDPPPQLLERGP